MSEASERAMRQMATARRGERIRTLEAENERLREGLERIASASDPFMPISAAKRIAREYLSPGETRRQPTVQETQRQMKRLLSPGIENALRYEVRVQHGTSGQSLYYDTEEDARAWAKDAVDRLGASFVYVAAPQPDGLPRQRLVEWGTPPWSPGGDRRHTEEG